MKFGLSWGKMSITHFVTQFSHVSRHFGVYNRKQKKIVRESCFKNWCHIKKNGIFVHIKKRRKKSERKKEEKKHGSIHNLWRILGTKLDLLVDFGDRIFKTVFPKQFFCSLF